MSVSLEHWSLSVGPSYGIGQANTVGIDTDSYLEYCAQNTEDPRCGAPLSELSEVSVSGLLGVGGGTAGLSWNGWETPSQDISLGVLGGAQTDALRWYPWVQLAVSVRGR